MGRKAKVCFRRLSAPLSAHKYLCEIFMPNTLQSKGNHFPGAEQGERCWKPGLPWSLWTLSSLCHSWIQGLNAVICFSLWCQKTKAFHFVICLSFVFILSFMEITQSEAGSPEYFWRLWTMEGREKEEVLMDVCLSLSLWAPCSFSDYFFLLGFFRGFLGSPLVDLEEYLLFCASALPLSPWVAVQALHEHCASL